MRKRITAIILLAMLTLFAGFALADPNGAAVGPGATSRYGGVVAGGTQVDAIAGNVTQLDINGTSITQGWQGYYGNVLGSILLGNSDNETLYDWTVASPGGEIYASRASSLTWANVNCSNSTHMATEESALGFGAASADGVNETFGGTYSWFLLGTNNLTSCPSTTLHNSTAENTDAWSEVLLSDGTNMVYTAIVANNADGFDGSTHDFQLIVAENGHADTSTTNYYFWAELE